MRPLRALRQTPESPDFYVAHAAAVRAFVEMYFHYSGTANLFTACAQANGDFTTVQFACT